MGYDNMIMLGAIAGYIIGSAWEAGGDRERSPQTPAGRIPGSAESFSGA
jgi:hypothetical protein